MKCCAAFLLAALPTLAASQQQPHHARAEQPQVLAPGYSALEFPVPAAGSYSLPSLGKAADGDLLDSSGTAATLHALYDNKTVVLSFIYTACPDVNGCPLATFVLSLVQRRLSSDEHLRAKVRLVTVSFDPANDSPAVMANYGKSFRRGDVDWRFLTAGSEESLAPILDDYDQAVIRDRSPDGQLVGSMSHILRVFLIDSEKNIRNIYSPSYLHPDILLADIRTVTQ
jgi:cytochrome oxidase Cu insertion factor (SCO1/SenC/PrrC family)